jgi:hypothetical protein
MLKAREPDFVYVNTHIINIITSLCVDRPRRKSYGGLSSTRKGKGRDKRLGKGVKIEGLPPKEYYNIFLKGIRFGHNLLS